MVNLTLTNDQPGPPAEGRVILELLDAEQNVYFHWTSNDLVATSTPRKVGWWLPPRVSTTSRRLMLQATWRDTDGLDTFISEWPIDLPRRSDVSTHLAVVLNGQDQAPPTELLKRVNLAESIQLNAQIRASQTNEYVSKVLADQMPKSPLLYNAFGGIILPPEGFAKLQPQQLTAIQRWVRAGGRIILLPYGEPLRKEHEQFLRAVAAGGSDPGTYDLDPRTRMLREPSTNYSLHRHGLGRTLILRSIPQLSYRAQRVAWYRAGGSHQYTKRAAMMASHVSSGLKTGTPRSSMGRRTMESAQTDFVVPFRRTWRGLYASHRPVRPQVTCPLEAPSVDVVALPRSNALFRLRHAMVCRAQLRSPSRFHTTSH